MPAVADKKNQHNAKGASTRLHTSKTKVSGPSKPFNLIRKAYFLRDDVKKVVVLVDAHHKVAPPPLPPWVNLPLFVGDFFLASNSLIWKNN